jgi:hypothetical protein
MKEKKKLISIENLHLISGSSLIISAILVYFIDGIEMTLSWGIFGAMYISMSDIGEDEMSKEKLKHLNHKVRRLFGYFGAYFSIVLVLFYLNKLFL